MAVDKALISGSMTMLLLRLLAEKDMYGYEMIDTLRKKSCNVFELKAGTLYPLLHGLEGKGLLKVYEQEYVGKTRKYYSITKEGRALLETKKAEWNEYQSAVANVLAMGNAIDEVKERADIVIGSNDEEGIADFIENEIL